MSYSFSKLGFKFRTGPIVDFRAQAYIKEIPIGNTVPLIWSCNFNETHISWSKEAKKFPQYIEENEWTKNKLIPNKNYVFCGEGFGKRGKKASESKFVYQTR